jgi:hypothetical protein
MLALKNVLRINAISSGVTGLGLIAFASTVASLFGLNNGMAVSEVGIFLLVFATFVFREGQRTAPKTNAVKVIIALDVTWVAASGLIVVFQLFELTLLGYLSISAVALWVAAMAYLQNAGLKQLTYTKN